MLEVLHFIFSSFWVWLGTLMLLWVGGMVMCILADSIIRPFVRGRT
jgi:hypothetical protein